MSRISLAVAFLTAVFAALIMSPSGRLYLACLAALVGLIPLTLGDNKLRIYSLFAIAAATGVAVQA